MPADVLIAAGAEGHLAGAGQENAAYRRVVTNAVEGIDELIDGFRSEGVPHLRPIDREAGYAGAGVVVQDVTVLGYRRPRGAGHQAISYAVVVGAGAFWALMKGITTARKRVGASTSGALPTPSTTASLAPGMPRTTNSERVRTGSSSPVTTRVAART